jgi:hypothetical protein
MKRESVRDPAQLKASEVVRRRNLRNADHHDRHVRDCETDLPVLDTAHDGGCLSGCRSIHQEAEHRNEPQAAAEPRSALDDAGPSHGYSSGWTDQGR